MPRAGLLDCFDIDSMISRMISSNTSSGVTYGNIYRNFGLSEMQIEGQFTESPSYGDATTLDYFARLKMINFSFKNQWVTFDWLTAVLAGQSMSSGSSPNEQRVIGFGAVNTPSFELDFQTKYIGPNGSLTGDAHVIAHCCRLNKWTLGMKSESRQEISGEGVGIPLLYQEPGWNFPRCFSIVENETAAMQAVGSADLTAPTISSFTPTAAASSVATNTTLTWTFSEALDPTSVNEGNFILATSAGVYVTFSSITLNAAGTVVTATPSSALVGSTAYKWTVTRGVRDRAGNRLAAINTNTFTTA